MRYVKTENTILAGELESGTTVKIKLINMLTDELLPINSDICVESQHIPGTYLWPINNIDQSVFDNLVQPMSVLYSMYVTGANAPAPAKGQKTVFKGKIVIGGELNNLSTITTIDTNVKNNNQLATINQTELKTILNSADTGLPKIISQNTSTLSSITNIGTKVDNNYTLTSQQLNVIKSLVSRKRITFATSLN